MNASLRAILTAFAGFAAVLLIIWGVDHGIVQPAFVALERTQALEDGARAQAAIQSELRQLDNVLGNWAAWDDAYAFADSRDPAFIQSNPFSYTHLAVYKRQAAMSALIFCPRGCRRSLASGLRFSVACSFCCRSAC